jgi:serine/threonine-protein kinase HipA
MSEPVTVWTSEGADVRVGTLYPHRRRGTESATFSYDAAYLAQPDAYAIDPQLSLSATPHQTAASRALFGAMLDGAPDRWGRTLLLRREASAARHEGCTPRALSEVDFLLGVRDDLRQGALRYSAASGEFVADEEHGVPALTELPALLDLADRAERDTATLPDLQRLVHAGGSLGGARPKAHVTAQDGTLALAKFPSAERDTWDVMAWEFVTLHLADAAGIAVPRSELLTLADRRVLVVQRFDRRYGSTGASRIGYASAMTMLEASDGDGASYLDIAAVIEERSDRASRDLEQLWRRMLFSVLVGNTDDHLRNHGFLHVPGRDAWRLSPAFDMNPHPIAGPKHHATSIDGTGGPATVAAVQSVAQSFRLSDAEASGITATVMDSVAGWKTRARSAGLSSRAIEAMAPAFDHGA